MKHTMNISLGFILALSTILLTSRAEGQTPSQPQNQSSLGDYARKVHKDTGDPKAKPKVFDNDNLPKDDKLSIVGQQPVAQAKAATVGDTREKTATPADSKAAAEGKAATGTKTAATATED